MAANEHELKRAAGMDENTDVALGTDKSSILMSGLSVRYPGVLEPIVSEKQLFASSSRGYILGQFYYLGADPSLDRLIVVYGNRTGASGCAVYKYIVSASITASGTLDVTVDGGTLIDNHCVNAVVQAGKRICICQFGSELVFTQEGGCHPFRYNGTALYDLGVTKSDGVFNTYPIVAAPAPTLASSVPAGSLTGLFQYAISYADGSIHESPLNNGLGVYLDNANALLTWGAAPSSSSVTAIKLYRTIAGGSTYRLVASFGTGAQSGYTDTMSDATLAGQPAYSATSSPLGPMNDGTIAVGLTGTFVYVLTYADVNGNETYYSAPMTVTLANATQKIKWDAAPSGLGINRIYLYRTTNGGSTYYRVNQTGYATTAGTANDSLADATLVTHSTRNHTSVSGSYQYWVTCVDEQGRESNPCAAFSFTATDGFPLIGWNASSDPQVFGYYLYRTASTGTVGYRVTESIISTNYYWDTLSSDTTLQAHTQSPRAFENSVPDSASWCHVWKNRLALNSTVNTRRVQISNLASPTQFSLENDARYPSDGQTRTVYTNLGDEITGLFSIGSALGVFSRKSITVIVGDSPANFQFRAPQRTGCTSPYTLEEIDGETWFRSDDGIYAASFEGGFNVRCVSDQIDRQFQMLRVPYPTEYDPNTTTVWFSQADRQSSAIAKCLSNRYHLSQPPYDCIFDARTKQWAMQPMLGMPDQAGYYNYGYTSMCMGSIGGRAYDVLFISAGDLYNSNTPHSPGNLHVRALVPIESELNFFSRIQYVTRAVDGAGVPRNSNKTATRITVFGEGIANASFSGMVISVYYDRDPNFSFQNGTAPQKVDYTVNLTADEITRFARLGIICQLEVNTPPARVMCIGFKAQWNGRPFDIRDVLVEYVREDSA
jgi:hypothetical protein